MRSSNSFPSSGVMGNRYRQNSSSLSGVAITGITATCSDGIITFSHTSELNVDKSGINVVIYSGFGAGTGYATFPSADTFNSSYNDLFDEYNKSQQNIYQYAPSFPLNKWRSSAAPGNPYLPTNSVNSTMHNGYQQGCNSYGPGYYSLRSYTALNGVYDAIPEAKLLLSADPTGKTYTINVNEINALPGRAATATWKFNSPLVSGNARVYIRPWAAGKYIHENVGSIYYNYGNWSHFDVNITGASIPNRVPVGPASGFTLSGRKVSWQSPGTNLAAYFYVYKNNIELRKGWNLNDNNPGAYNAAGDLSYTVPAGDGSGNFQMYIYNYSLITQSWAAEAIYSWSL